MSIFKKEVKPQPYTVKDKQLVCSHCGNDTFTQDDIMVHYRGDLTNKYATVFICSNCTNMTWFTGQPGTEQ
jgi:predicted nucleic-acid-binding Zn-ribbon protein